MTRRNAAILLGIAALIGAALLAWRIFFPDDEARIVRCLDRAAEAVTIREGEPPVAPVKLHKLDQLLDDRIEFNVRFNRQEYAGSLERGEVPAKLTVLRKSGLKFDLKLSGYGVVISGDAARVEAEASVTGVARGEKFSLQEDVEISLVRRGGEWRISRIHCRNFMEK